MEKCNGDEKGRRKEERRKWKKGGGGYTRIDDP